MTDRPILPPAPAANDVVVHEVSPIQVGQKERLALAKPAFEAMERDIAEKSLFVMHGALSFAEIDPYVNLQEGEEPPGPPAAWVEELEQMYPGRGEELAEQKLRVARAAWLPSKEAPVGLKMAQMTAIGLARIRAGDRQAGRNLNVQVVNVINPRQQYEELEVEERRK